MPIRICIVALCGIVGFAGLSGCGDAQENPTRLTVGIPVGATPSDPAILGDITQYQPAKPPSVTAAGPGGSKSEVATGSGGDAEAQVQARVEALLRAVQEGDVEAAVGSFNPEHVAALGEARDAMVLTFERLDQFTRFLKEKTDPTELEQVLGPLSGGAAHRLQFELLDPQHASVTPNVAVILFGPVGASPALRLEQADGKWQFQLDGPLTEADSAKIKAFHDELQVTLDALIDKVDAAETVNIQELAAAWAAALGGQAPAAAPGGEPGPADEPPAGEASGTEADAAAEDAPEDEPRARSIVSPGRGVAPRG